MIQVLLKKDYNLGNFQSTVDMDRLEWTEFHNDKCF